MFLFAVNKKIEYCGVVVVCRVTCRSVRGIVWESGRWYRCGQCALGAVYRRALRRNGKVATREVSVGGNRCDRSANWCPVGRENDRVQTNQTADKFGVLRASRPIHHYQTGKCTHWHTLASCTPLLANWPFAKWTLSSIALSWQSLTLICWLASIAKHCGKFPLAWSMAHLVLGIFLLIALSDDASVSRGW